MPWRTLDSILNSLPGGIVGPLEWYLRPSIRSVGPMNGQTARLEIVRSIIEKYNIEQIIETGTFRGTTTEWFSQFGLPVFSVELHPRFFAYSRRRLIGRQNVQIDRGDSVAALERWSKAPNVASRRTLFYLDAHWKENLPLRDELAIINRNFKSWIVVIDDFKVPLDADYGFDDYGPGRVIDMEYISRCNIPDAIAFFPSVDGRWETGKKRGCVIIAANRELASKCYEMPLLRPSSSADS